MNESDNKQKDQSNDEIDIFEFCSRIYMEFKRLIIRLKDSIVSVIIFLIRKSLWAVSFALFGYLWHNISKPYYSSSLKATTGGIYDETEKKYIGGVDNVVIIDHINKLDKLTKKPDLLANYLNVKKNVADNIRSIKAFYGIDVNKDMRPDYIDMKDSYNPKDTIQVRVPSYIYIKVSVLMSVFWLLCVKDCYTMSTIMSIPKNCSR